MFSVVLRYADLLLASRSARPGERGVRVAALNKLPPRQNAVADLTALGPPSCTPSCPVRALAAMLTPRCFSRLSRTACLSSGATPISSSTPWNIGLCPRRSAATRHAARLPSRAAGRDVDDHLHVGDAVNMVGDAHRPAEDEALAGREIDVGDVLDLGFLDSERAA